MSKESRKEYMKAYRQKRKAAGICVRCGKPTNSERCSCDGCLEIARVKQQARYRQKAIEKLEEERNEQAKTGRCKEC